MWTKELKERLFEALKEVAKINAEAYQDSPSNDHQQLNSAIFAQDDGTVWVNVFNSYFPEVDAPTDAHNPLDISITFDKDWNIADVNDRFPGTVAKEC